ncbi:hypothetical protein ACTAQI_20365 [Pseudarthrobacter sp. alpha12b]
MPVAFTSKGYDTTVDNPYTEASWAEAHPVIGSATYGVRSPLDWKVTAVAGQDRTVSINAGRGFGHGVTDKTVDNDTIQLATISSGSRWDLIVARRDWTPTAGVTKFEKVNGGATATIPGGRLYGPGNIDDQPLALVQVTAGQTQPTAIIDLRTWTGDGGGLVANHDLVRSYLNQVGTRININGVDWVRRVGENDTPEWVKGTEIGKATLYGAGSALLGVASAGDFLVQAGTLVAVSDGAGFGRLTFPKAFPNGLLYVGLTNGDGWASGPGVTFAAAGSVTVGGTPNFWGQSGYGSKADIVYEVAAADGAKATNRSHRINWIAIGW